MNLQITKKEFKDIFKLVARASETTPMNTTQYRRVRNLRKILVANFWLNTNEMIKFRNEEPKLVRILKKPK